MNILGGLIMKSRLLAVLSILVVWMGIDFLFHGIWLMPDYTQTAVLWRPMAEMKSGLMHSVSVVTAFLFVFIWCTLISEKNSQKAIRLGVGVGLIVGIMQAGGYSYMPITTTIAIGWFFANLIKFSMAGIITGFLVKSKSEYQF